MKNVYIIGKDDGSDRSIARFDRALEFLKGWDIVPLNPNSLREVPKEQKIRVCDLLIEESDEVYVLLGWEDDERAREEYHFAKDNNIPVVYETVEDLRKKDIKQRKVYVAGGISGVEDFKERFDEAVEELEKEGYAVLNPAVFPPGFEQNEYMHICYAMIDVCDTIFFLDNWQTSVGAQKERVYGDRQGKSIWYQDVNGDIEPGMDRTVWTDPNREKVTRDDLDRALWEGNPLRNKSQTWEEYKSQLRIVDKDE